MRPTFRKKIMPCLAAAAWGCLTASGHELRDLKLSGERGRAFADFEFGRAAGKKGFPLYFHQSDAERGLFLISFLETGSTFPLGDYDVEKDGGPVRRVRLKRYRSPGGKNFLGIEIDMEDPPARVSLSEKGDAAVRLVLAENAKGNIAWSLAEAYRARSTGPSPAESPAAMIEAPQASSRSTAPAAAAAKDAAQGAAMDAARGTLKEIRLMASPARETLVLDLGGRISQFGTARRPDDSTWLVISLQAGRDMARQEYVFSHGGVFRRIRIRPEGEGIVAEIQAVGAGLLHVIPRDGELHVTSASGKVQSPYKWSSKSPDARPVIADAQPDPVEGAHESGKQLEKRAQSPSSSTIFTPAGGGKPMILLKDSISLRSEPRKRGPGLRLLGAGEKVAGIEPHKDWMKIAAEGDTGFVPAGAVVYADEATPGQLAAVARALEARTPAQPPAPAPVPETLQLAESSADIAKARKPVPPAPEMTEPPKEVPMASARPVASEQAQAMARRLAQEKKAAEEEKIKIKLAEKVTYNTYGRRDPFVPVEGAGYDNGIIIDQVKVVGIIWQRPEPIAVLEHTKESGVSFTVKQGDPVHNGRVSRITRDAVTFNITEYGISRSYSLKLVSQEGVKR